MIQISDLWNTCYDESTRVNNVKGSGIIVLRKSSDDEKIISDKLIFFRDSKRTFWKFVYAKLYQINLSLLVILKELFFWFSWTQRAFCWTFFCAFCMLLWRNNTCLGNVRSCHSSACAWLSCGVMCRDVWWFSLPADQEYFMRRVHDLLCMNNWGWSRDHDSSDQPSLSPVGWPMLIWNHCRNGGDPWISLSRVYLDLTW